MHLNSYILFYFIFLLYIFLDFIFYFILFLFLFWSMKRYYMFIVCYSHGIYIVNI